MMRSRMPWGLAAMHLEFGRLAVAGDEIQDARDVARDRRDRS